MTEPVESYIDGEIEGVVMRPLKVFNDSRGWLVELFRQDELVQEWWPVMTYVSQTLPGVTRGPHEHVDQTDGFAFLGPSDFKLFLWDIRSRVVQRGVGVRSWCLVHQTRRRSGFRRESCMRIAISATCRGLFSTPPIDSTPAGVRKSQSTRSATRKPSLESSPWIEGFRQRRLTDGSRGNGGRTGVQCAAARWPLRESEDCRRQRRFPRD